MLELQAAAELGDAVERTELLEVALGGDAGDLKELGAADAVEAEGAGLVLRAEPPLAALAAAGAGVVLEELLAAERAHGGGNLERLAGRERDVHRAEGDLLHIISRVDELDHLLELLRVDACGLRYVGLRRAAPAEHGRVQPHHAPLVLANLEPVLLPEQRQCEALSPLDRRERREPLPLLCLAEPAPLCILVRSQDVLDDFGLGGRKLPLLQRRWRDQRLGNQGDSILTAARIDRRSNAAHDCSPRISQLCALTRARFAPTRQVDRLAQLSGVGERRAVDADTLRLESSEHILERERRSGCLVVAIVAVAASAAAAFAAAAATTIHGIIIISSCRSNEGPTRPGGAVALALAHQLQDDALGDRLRLANILGTHELIGRRPGGPLAEGNEAARVWRAQRALGQQGVHTIIRCTLRFRVYIACTSVGRKTRFSAPPARA